MIDHVFVPMRDLEAAAASRNYVHEQGTQHKPLWKRILRCGRLKGVPGGLTRGAADVSDQEKIPLHRIYALCLALSDADVPVSFLRFPRLTRDCSYLYGKLSPILKGIREEIFRNAFQATVRPELVHRFSSSDV